MARRHCSGDGSRVGSTGGTPDADFPSRGWLLPAYLEAGFVAVVVVVVVVETFLAALCFMA